MREVNVEGRVIRSPWLRPVEAAAYCGISRSSFDERAVKLPHGGDGRTRLYHIEVLDRWIDGLLDVPFEVQPMRARKYRSPREKIH